MVSDKNNCIHKIEDALYAFNSLSIYRKVLKDPVMIELQKLIKYTSDTETHFIDFLNLYNNFFYSFVSASSVSLKEYIIKLILHDENPFTTGIENEIGNIVFTTVESAAVKDLYNLELISKITSQRIKTAARFVYSDVSDADIIIDALPSWDFNNIDEANRPEFNNKDIYTKFMYSDKWSHCINSLKEYHLKYGTGDFSRFKAFKLIHNESKPYLIGIPSPDPVQLSDLIGYEAEREAVVDNTKQFLRGFRSNNVLLYGDRGTGKSSTVKAILNEYWQQGLRLVEITKSSLADFPKLIELLRNHRQRFIVFVDDLAFEDNEQDYTALKAVLEGGIESKPDNVLIYATSNRRHLVKEKFSDRSGLQYGSADDEVRANDSIQEKLSLADRFGITVVFSSPDKKRYLQIVEGLVKQREIDIGTEELHREALKWELWYNGRSPRTAKQFVDWLEGNVKTK